MPGSFMSDGGCLFSFLAWAGIFFGIAPAFISSIISHLSKKKSIVLSARLILWLLPIAALLLIVGNYYYLSDVRDALSNEPRIGRAPMDAFKYFPPYEYTGYFQLGFPTTAEANTSVRELRITTAAMLFMCITALITAILRHRTLKHQNDGKRHIGWLPYLIIGAGGIIVVVVHVIFFFL